jgi:hypothetical protein
MRERSSAGLEGSSHFGRRDYSHFGRRRGLFKKLDDMRTLPAAHDGAGA